jgi:Cu/Ag efflux protein CusF
MMSGQVMKVDQSAGKITLKHGPMKKFNMDEGMTMVYQVQDPSLLNRVKVGDKVQFDAERVNGVFTVTKIQKAGH